MRSTPRSSGARRPTATRMRSPPRCRRSASTAPGSPPRSTAKPRARASWKRPTARSRSGWTRPWPRSSRCSTASMNPNEWAQVQDEQAQRSQPMAQVTATIAGRQFRLACEDGQEDHLLALSADIDDRIVELRQRFGEIGDTRLTVMAALMVADEMSEARAQDPPPGRGHRHLAGRPRGRRPTAPSRPPPLWSAPSTRPPSASRASPGSSTRPSARASPIGRLGRFHLFSAGAGRGKHGA